VVVAAVALTHAAATLRIVPIVRDKSVIVSVELADAFTKEVRDSIASGLRTTITYDVELKMEASVWVDRTIASAVVTTSDHYDNLTRVHNLSRTIDGRLVDALVTENEALARQWLTTLKELPVCPTSKLDPHGEYYVRISARVRPPGASLLGLASAITNQAKFTFIP
jgi:hypothetical protein